MHNPPKGGLGGPPLLRPKAAACLQIADSAQITRDQPGQTSARDGTVSGSAIGRGALVPSLGAVRKGQHEVGGGASAGRTAAEWRRPNRPWPNRALFTLIDR